MIYSTYKLQSEQRAILDEAETMVVYIRRRGSLFKIEKVRDDKEEYGGQWVDCK